MTAIDVCTGEGVGVRLVGQAFLTRSRARVSTTFLYDGEYLASGGMGIDPSLPTVPGAQHGEGLLGALADSAPDRWGRSLIEKAERIRARQEERSPRRLDDVDFLLGVSDDTRQGALRFRLAGHEEFLGAPAHVPPLVSLPELLHASDELTMGEDSISAVKTLLNTGTTGLGGARPKASVRLEDGSLAMAKFPHPGDQWDVMAWECLALDLLDRAGVDTPERRLVRVGERNVLVLRRFDRAPGVARIGYISARTATSTRDGEQGDYADVAEAMRDFSPSLRRDLATLFDRVVASVVLGNTDDHLRNLGFLGAQGFWTPSPAFDVNPTPDPTRARATSIMGADTFPDEVGALEALGHECGMTSTRARERMARIVEAVSSWRDLARSRGIAGQEIAAMGESIDVRRSAVDREARR